MTEEIYQNIFLDSGNIRGSIKWSAITKLSFIRQMICCYTFIYKGKINHPIWIKRLFYKKLWEFFYLEKIHMVSFVCLLGLRSN